MVSKERLPASFRDPDGYVYRTENGTVLRQLTGSGVDRLFQLYRSGLYSDLTEANMLVEHQQLDAETIYPNQIPFISYPQEWTFSMLRDAALLTLAAEIKAMRHGMTLKDASAYNVQFLSGKPILIDSLSFMEYEDGAPWYPYRQFCQHFLAPLAVMAHRGIRLPYGPHGVNLQDAGSMYGWLGSPSLLAHLRAQGWADNHEGPRARNVHLSQNKRLALLDNLRSLVAGFKPKLATPYHYQPDEAYQQSKLNAIREAYKSCNRMRVLDVGCYDARWSRSVGLSTVGIDTDEAILDETYRQRHAGFLPLLVDINNPTPGIGWANQERESFLDRAEATDFNAVLGLALMHHLILDNNVNFTMMARLFSRLGKDLIIEYIPPSDPLVQIKSGGFAHLTPGWWNQNCFEGEFCQLYELRSQTILRPTERELYHFTRRS
jgi:hypothetical protein